MPEDFEIRYATKEKCRKIDALVDTIEESIRKLQEIDPDLDFRSDGPDGTMTIDFTGPYLLIKVKDYRPHRREVTRVIRAMEWQFPQ
jgi:hypothetical protein